MAQEKPAVAVDEVARKLVLVEPWLRDFNGHPYRYCKAILEAGALRGLVGRVVGAVGISPQLAVMLPVIPVFRTYAQSSRNHTWWLRVPRRFGRCLKDVAALRRHIASNDVVFVTSADAFHLLAFAVLAHSCLPRASFTIMLRYGIPEDHRAAGGVWRWIYRLAFALSPRRLRFVSDSALLGEQYRKLGAGHVGLVGIPHGHAAGSSRHPEPRERIVVGVVGHTVVDKGVVEAVEAISKLAGDPIAKRLRFVVQLYAPPNISDDLVERLERALGDLPADYCSVRRGALPDAGYEALLNSLDAAIFPYYPERYQGTSGIFVEMACRGRPTAITRGTWMASMVREMGLAGVEFDARSVSSLCDALRGLVTDWERWFALAQAKAPGVARFHSGRGVLEAVIGK